MTIKNEEILSYNPDLSINKRPEVEANFESTNGYEVSDFKSNRSVVLNEFELNKPSSKIDMLLNLENEIEEYKEKISEKITSNPMAILYFNNETEAEKEETLIENSKDMINGSTLLEAYTVLDNMQKEVSMVKDNFIISVYGKDIDIDKVAEVDEAYINKMDSYEFNNEHQYINYFNLYYDTQISYLIGEYVYKISNAALELSYIDDIAFSTKADKNTENIMKKSFDKNNELLAFDMSKDKDCFNQLRIALKNVFITKQELNLYYDFLYSLDCIEDELEIVYDVKKENVNDLNEKMDNLIKAVMLSEISKHDVYSTLSKKSKIRGFFTM